MSKLLENKQMVHIVSEIVILLGVVFYFSNKNKAILNHIEDLNQRLEEQEEKIDKQEQVLRNLVLQVKSLSQVGVPSGVPVGVSKIPLQPAQKAASQPVASQVDSVGVPRPAPQPAPEPVEQVPIVLLVSNEIQCTDSVCKITELRDELETEMGVDSVDLDNELKAELEELEE